RQTQDFSVCRGPGEAEERALADALSAGSSVKFTSRDSPIRGATGSGYAYINSSLTTLQALAVLRTGRRLAVLDGTARAGGGFVLQAGLLGNMPGTALEATVPIMK